MQNNGKDKNFKITQDNISHIRTMAGEDDKNAGKIGATNNDDRFYQSMNAQSEKIEKLVQQIEKFPNPQARALLAECMEAVLGLQGNGLMRIFEIIRKTDGAASQAKQNLLQDDFIKGLLLLHGLHPDDLETRLYRALEKVKPYMDSHGGSVKVVGLEDGVATLKLEGSCDGCPSSVSTLELGIKEAIEEECPDLLGLEVDGLADNPLAQEIKKNNGVAKSGDLSQNGKSSWTVINGLEHLSNGQKQSIEVKDTLLIICKVEEKLYAYQNKCPGCGMPFDTGTLINGNLKCKLGHEFMVKKAGKSPDDPHIHLAPFPLIQENGNIKIAVG